MGSPKYVMGDTVYTVDRKGYIETQTIMGVSQRTDGKYQYAFKRMDRIRDIKGHWQLEMWIYPDMLEAGIVSKENLSKYIEESSIEILKQRGYNITK